MKTIIYTIIMAIVFSGCAQKTIVKAVKAPKVDDKSIQNISVLKFQNDTIGQSQQISSAMANVKFDKKKYFTLIDRANIDKILKEKELNDSGLVVLKDDKPTDGLSEVKTLLTGKVNNIDMSTSSFYEERTNYNNCIEYKYTKHNKKYCATYQKYSVLCRTNSYNLNTSIKIIKVSNSKILFAKTYQASSKYTHCTDDNHILPTKQNQGVVLAHDIAQQIVYDIAPSYQFFKVRLLKNPDIYYSMQEKSTLKLALELIDKKKYKYANKLLKKLNKSLKYKSYVGLYDLGLSYEILGNLNKALQYYKQADDIAIMEQNKSIDDITLAIKRVKQNQLELNQIHKLK